MHVLGFLLIFCALPPLSAHSQETGSRGLQELRAQANRRIALCIGINHYTDKKLNTLKKSANDAYGLASVLEKQGNFKTYIFSDQDSSGKEKTLSDRLLPTKRQIEEFFSSTASFGDIKGDDLVVFSFSGHGISDSLKNGYLLPMEWNSADPYNSAIPVVEVTDWLERLGVTKSLVLIDACREEMSASRSLDTMPRLYDEKFLTANVSAVFYATKQGGFSYEDPESRYGAFTRFLIDGLGGAANANGDEVVTFRELSTYVEDGLGDWALKNGYRQRPYTRIFGEQSGDLALTAADGGSGRKIPLPQTTEPRQKQPVVSQQPVISPGKIAGISMVPIPGGTFRMGSNEGDDDEKPIHTVSVSAFEMSATEITQGQYSAVMGSNPSKFKGDDYLPVENVKWLEAIKFCNVLSELGGLQRCYYETIGECDFSKNGFRLPTEAEWEYACRAGTATKYCTGNAERYLALAGWYRGNTDVVKTHSVGQKAPNAWGLYDMHGNVWEWCQDWYGSYPSGSDSNPTGTLSGSSRVIRGGSWYSSAGSCRSTDRYGYPGDRNMNIGFRVVRRP